MNAPLQQDNRLVKLRNDQVSVEVATRGARITSLKGRGNEREWLTQAIGVARCASARGARFTDTDHFGWDEMFPSVDACVFPVEPFVGAEVVDHGELWTTIWETLEATSTTLVQRATSDSFAYTFQRDIVLDGSTLHANYACVVDRSVRRPLPLLWALHPQFAMRDGSRLELSGVGSSVLDTSDPASVRSVEWGGDLVVERDVAAGSDRMIYVTPGDGIAEARIVDVDGSTLRLTWDHVFAPYLGIWMDYGRHTSGRAVAIEPTNGFFDDLARAHDSGFVGVFNPGERVTWWVKVEIDEGGGSCANS